MMGMRVTEQSRPRLIWRVKTYLRNRRWNRYWDWETREDNAHIADIGSYRAVFGVFDDDLSDDGFLMLVPYNQKECKFCGRVGVRAFTKAGRDTWRCSAIKACVARAKRIAA